MIQSSFLHTKELARVKNLQIVMKVGLICMSNCSAFCQETLYYHVADWMLNNYYPSFGEKSGLKSYFARFIA